MESIDFYNSTLLDDRNSLYRVTPPSSRRLYLNKKMRSGPLAGPAGEPGPHGARQARVRCLYRGQSAANRPHRISPRWNPVPGRDRRSAAGDAGQPVDTDAGQRPPRCDRPPRNQHMTQRNVPLERQSPPQLSGKRGTTALVRDFTRISAMTHPAAFCEGYGPIRPERRPACRPSALLRLPA